MKKLIVLLFVGMLMIAQISVYADEIDEKSKIPPVEGFKFSMAIEDIHNLLGLPDDKEEKYGYQYETYYDIEYFNILGHLIFSYEDEQIHGVYWESPAQKDMNQNCIDLIDSVQTYYDNKVGTDENIKSETTNENENITVWINDFDKIEYSLIIEQNDAEVKIEIGFNKMLDLSAMQEAISELPTLSQEQLDEISALLEEQIK